MMKKIYSLLLILTMAISTFAYDFVDWANDTIYDNPGWKAECIDSLYYDIIGENKVSLVGFKLYYPYFGITIDMVDSVIIPITATNHTTNETYQVTEIADSVFYAMQYLSYVKLPDSLNKIGASAFASCNYLRSITIPKRVTSIGMSVFKNCSKLGTVICHAPIPPTLGTDAFANISSTAVLHVPYNSLETYKSTEEYTNAFDTIIGFSEVEEVTANSATISWIPTPEATEYTISVYTSDTLFRQYHVDGDGNLIEPQNAPHHIHPIKKDTTYSTDEFYVLTMDGLDEATDYVYTITGTNSAQQQVYHEEGSFRTTENSEGFLDTFADDPDKPRKTLRNGQIYILRREKIYTLTGQEVR